MSSSDSDDDFAPAGGVSGVEDGNMDDDSGSDAGDEVERSLAPSDVDSDEDGPGRGGGGSNRKRKGDLNGDTSKKRRTQGQRDLLPVSGGGVGGHGAQGMDEDEEDGE
ncbi:unnamed protein product, partial [Discosporangium mesarthrocarpum]